MKVKEAIKKLSSYDGDKLCGKANELYQNEIESRIEIRSKGKAPTERIIEDVVNEMRPWMENVGDGLHWNDKESFKIMIEHTNGRIWIKYEMTDPKIKEYTERVQQEKLKGLSNPVLDALTPEYLDAVSAMMIGQMQKAVEDLDAKEKSKYSSLPFHKLKNDE